MAGAFHSAADLAFRTSDRRRCLSSRSTRWTGKVTTTSKRSGSSHWNMPVWSGDLPIYAADCRIVVRTSLAIGRRIHFLPKPLARALQRGSVLRHGRWLSLSITADFCNSSRWPSILMHQRCIRPRSPVTLAVNPANPQIVLLWMSQPPLNGGILRSTDGGAAFTPSNSGVAQFAQRIARRPPSHTYGSIHLDQESWRRLHLSDHPKPAFPHFW